MIRRQSRILSKRGFRPFDRISGTQASSRSTFRFASYNNIYAQMTESVKVDAMGGKFDKIQVEKGDKICQRSLDWFVKKQKLMIEKLENGEAMGQESDFMQFVIKSNLPISTDNVLKLSWKYAKSVQNDSDTLLSDDSSIKTAPIYLAQISSLVSASVEVSVSASRPDTDMGTRQSENETNFNSPNDKSSIPGASGQFSSAAAAVSKKSFKPPAQVAPAVPQVISSPKSKSKGTRGSSAATPKSSEDAKKKRVRSKEVGTMGESKKAKRDPYAPKSGRSSYIIYTSEQRDAYVAEHPEEKFVEVTAGLALMWKNLSDEEKLPYTVMAAEEKSAQDVLIKQYILDNPESQLATKPSGRSSKPSKSPAKKAAKTTATDEGEIDVSNEGDESSAGRRSDRHRKSLAIAAVFNTAKMDAEMCYGDQSSSASSDSDDSHDAETPQGKRPRSKSVNLPAKQVTLKSQKPLFKVAGVKQSDLDQDEDLLHTTMLPTLKAAYPTDTTVAVGNQVAVILTPYRQFLSSLPHGLMVPLERNLVQQICNQAADFVFGTIDAICKPAITQKSMEKGDGLDSYDDLNLVTLRVNGLVLNILHVEFKSPILTCDVFVVPKQTFKTSMEAMWLNIGSPIRRSFAAEIEEEDDLSEKGAVSLPPNERIEYLEGIVYYVKPDMKTNPFNSVLVIWTNQKADSLAWVYSYNQTSNECSPWDLEASAFKKHDYKYGPHKFPRNFTVGILSASVILDYLKDHNAAGQFIYDVAGVSDEFRAKFPDKKDHLDLGLLSKQVLRGHYEGNTGITALFRDLERMIANSKTFNEDNVGFLPWRLSDMMEKTVMQIKAVIAKERNIISLQESIKEELSLQMEMELEFAEEV